MKKDVLKALNMIRGIYAVENSCISIEELYISILKTYA